MQAYEQTSKSQKNTRTKKTPTKGKSESVASIKLAERSNLKIYTEEETKESNKADFYGKLGLLGLLMTSMSHTAATCVRAATTNPVLLIVGIALSVIGLGFAWYFKP